MAAPEPCNIRTLYRMPREFAPGRPRDTSPKRRKGLLSALAPKILILNLKKSTRMEVDLILLYLEILVLQFEKVDFDMNQQEILSMELLVSKMKN